MLHVNEVSLWVTVSSQDLIGVRSFWWSHGIGRIYFLWTVFPFPLASVFPWLSARGHIQFLVIKAFKMNIAHNNLFYQSREGRGSYNMVETTSLWSITLKCHSTICEIFHPLGPSCSSHPHYRIENYKRM